MEKFKTRVYPLTTSPDLTEEQIAVAFAMTSRRPEPFDEIAEQLTLQKASEFHEKWVLDYGHSSVAEHAVIHMALENISRLACDALEDNRLASYTEKSSRYQVFSKDFYHIPEELTPGSQNRRVFIEACNGLFDTYHTLVEGVTNHLTALYPSGARDPRNPYGRPPARIAPDHCRAILPAATLTNVGLTANARSLQNLTSKLLSHPLLEPARLGGQIATAAKEITPTLLSHSGWRPHIHHRQTNTYAAHQDAQTEHMPVYPPAGPTAVMVHSDDEAVTKVAAAILFSTTPGSYWDAYLRARLMTPPARAALIRDFTALSGPHDPAPREFEAAEYTFDYTMDYGALREFKRHRIQSYFTQPLTVAHGYSVPPLIEEAGLAQTFHTAVGTAEWAFRCIHHESPALAQYLVTHAHYQKVMSKMNARECHHLFKLRTSQQAHFAIREPVDQAMHQAVTLHPELFQSLHLRDYPDWWPLPKPEPTPA